MRKGLLKNTLTALAVVPDGLRITYPVQVNHVSVIRGSYEISGPDTLPPVVNWENYKLERQLKEDETKKRTAGSETRVTCEMVGAALKSSNHRGSP